MNIPDRSPKTEKLLTVLTVGTILCFFAVFAVINFCCFTFFCEPDMYADTLVARLMWEGKTLFPFAYVFGNQLYVIATPVLSALFYGLGAGQNAAMALATTVMSLFIVLSFLWMLRPFANRRLSLCLGLLTLVSCVFGEKLVNQEQGQLLFILCSYYACYIINLFIVLGDYSRSFRNPQLRPVALALCLLLSFATGMQSLRQTCIMVLPILAFQALVLAISRIKDGHFNWQRYRASTCRALAYAAANLAGVLFVRLFDVHQYTIFDTAAPDFGQRLGDIYRACRDISGFCWADPEHPFFILLFVFQAALLIYAAVLQIKRWRHGVELSVMWWLLLISIAAVIAAALFTSLSIRSVYLFTYFPLLSLSVILVAEELSPARRSTLALGLCMLALGNLYASYLPSVRESLDGEENRYEQICDWAVERGYELVYGSHSNVAPMVAAYSDGKLISGGWNDEVMFKAQEYLNLQNIYSLEDVNRAIFVFQSYELDYAFEAAAVAGAELSFQGQYGDLSVYTSTVQLMYPRTYPWFDMQWPDWGREGP